MNVGNESLMTNPRDKFDVHFINERILLIAVTFNFCKILKCARIWSRGTHWTFRQSQIIPLSNLAPGLTDLPQMDFCWVLLVYHQDPTSLLQIQNLFERKSNVLFRETKKNLKGWKSCLNRIIKVTNDKANSTIIDKNMTGRTRHD